MLHNEFTIDAVYAAIDLHLLKLPKRLQREREDLRQNILLAVMERSVEYDPSLASWATFQDRLIEAYLENFMLSRRWRKNQSPESLDEIEEEETERVFKINDAHSWELNMQENTIFSAEVQNAIDTMPPRLCDCAELLKHYSPAETADMMSVPPNVLQRDMKKLRKIFKKAKLHPNNF
ncbi:MAG: hypothetical protein FWD31_12325 [Planctomycetaceae bacterium]|nr:hypothetical protein [Planctomycetaceae bacterium]